MAKYLRPTLKRYVYDKKMALFELINALQDKQTYIGLTPKETECLIEYKAQLNVIKDIEYICFDLNSN